jgi:hypothetical protein
MATDTVGANKISASLLDHHWLLWVNRHRTLCPARAAE